MSTDANFDDMHDAGEALARHSHTENDDIDDRAPPTDRSIPDNIILGEE